MRRRLLLTVLAFATMVSASFAVIQTATPLKLLVKDADNVFVASTESLAIVDADKANVLFKGIAGLKGKMPDGKIAVVLEEIKDTKSAGYLPNARKRFAAGSKSIWFVTPPNGMVRLARVFTEGTWMTLTGTEAEKGRIVWRLTSGEPFLRGTFKGTSDELETVLRDNFTKKTPLPAFDAKEKTGYGPELPTKESRLFDELDDIQPRAAVIPMIAVGGPIAILALLFPTVFGGVLILFRQWTAFITLLSVNSMILMIQWFMGHAWFHGTWLEADRSLWIVMTIVAFLCTVWAWRRQLANLSTGADAFDTPGRTEYLVLALLTTVCAGFIACTRFAFAPPPTFTDLAWDMTLALSGGIFMGLLYKIYRSTFEVMIPMSTEGVMLGTALLLHVLLLTQFAGAAASSASASAGEKWRITPTGERRGFLVSPPLIVDGKVLAAASLPAHKAGCLYSLDLETGKKHWDFIDNGTFKQVFSAPTVSDGRVYIGEGFHEDPNCKVYAIDLENGTKIWEWKTTSQTESSPIVQDGRVLIGAGNDGFLSLLDQRRGGFDWQFPPKEYKGRLLRFGAGAAVDDGRIYVGTGVDRLQETDKGETAFFCLDTISGKQIWKTPMPEPVWAAPVVHRGRVIVAVGNGDVFKDDETKPAGAVIALDAASGTIVWKRDLPNGVLQKPAVENGLVYVGCRDGRCYAIDVDKGDIRWSRDLESPVIAAPVVAGGAFYVVASSGQLASLHPATGKIVWLRSLWSPPADEPDLKGFFGASPAVSVRRDGDIVIRTIVVGGGGAEGSNPPVLVCLEDRDVVR